MWCECSRRISSLLFNPYFYLAAGQNGDSVRLNGRFLQACTRHKTAKTGSHRRNVSITRGWQQLAASILILMPIQVIGEPFIWKSIVAQSELNHVHTFNCTVYYRLTVGCYHVQPNPLPIPFFYPVCPVYFYLFSYTFSIMRNQIAAWIYKKKRDLAVVTRREREGTHFCISV